LVDCFDKQQLRMTFNIDAGTVFILREIMIKLFNDKLPLDCICAWCAAVYSRCVACRFCIVVSA
jgi:uncharacterized membrane protein (DUF373 family)